MSIKALERHLLPLVPYLQMEGVTEICINQPGQVFFEKQGQFACDTVPDLEYSLLVALAALIAEFNHKDFPNALLSGSLPTGERVQFVMPPACEKGKIVCSIRKHQRQEMTLEAYVKSGAFNHWYSKTSTSQHTASDWQKESQLDLLIKGAILNRKNILISGGTGTGKTTFLNACLKVIPMHERLITVEEAREVNVAHPNAVHLLFNEEVPALSALNLFKACLRLRPDRILLSELRGAEAWSYLRAANSGHPGSLSTIHADTPTGALTQLVFMMQQAGSTSNEEQIRNYIRSIIHLIIQLKRDTDGKRYVTEVWLNEQ
jgi:type IV secretion system protein VirB11